MNPSLAKEVVEESAERLAPGRWETEENWTRGHWTLVLKSRNGEGAQLTLHMQPDSGLFPIDLALGEGYVGEIFDGEAVIQELDRTCKCRGDWGIRGRAMVTETANWFAHGAISSERKAARQDQPIALALVDGDVYRGRSDNIAHTERMDSCCAVLTGDRRGASQRTDR